MAESVAVPVITTSGLAIFGVATGLEPGLLLAGLAGGWWALSYNNEPLPFLRRFTIGCVSALAGAWTGQWLSSALTAWLRYNFLWWPAAAGDEALRYSIALFVGLVAHKQLGPLLMRRVAAIKE